MQVGTLAEWVTVGIALVAAVGLVLQLRQTNLLRKHEFEDIYVQRYWQIMDGLTAEERVDLLHGRLPSGAAPHSETRRRLWAYLELCEDEADQRQAGLITTATWDQWKGGIHHVATRPPFNAILAGFDGELALLDDDARPFAQLRRAATSDGGPEAFDPRKKKWKDWFTG
ncbi:hypothetical protein ACIQC8_10680 [Agrococcus sediminis]|uniref:hypothetical protein n=1 Tax=Agrococcus sediminis TaxID=2599924 RepID=UPI00382F7BF0